MEKKTNKSKYIYMIRHGQSMENETGILSDGQSPLTEKGLSEAKIIAKRVKQLDVEVLLASHFTRAQQTAEEISKEIDLPIETHDFLFEVRYSNKTVGRHKDDEDIRELVTKSNENYFDENFQVDDAESFTMIKDRAKKALDLFANHQAERMAVVSHGNFIRALMGLAVFGDNFTGQDFADMIHGFHTVNTGLTWFAYNETFHRKPWRIVSWNDINHLADA